MSRCAFPFLSAAKVGGGLRIVQNKSTKEQDDSVTPQTNVEAGQWQQPLKQQHKRAKAKAKRIQGDSSSSSFIEQEAHGCCGDCCVWVGVRCACVGTNESPCVFLSNAALSTHQSQQDLERALGIPNENPTPAVRGPMEHPKVNASVRLTRTRRAATKQDFIRPSLACC
jgi:hypothetical protein